MSGGTAETTKVTGGGFCCVCATSQVYGWVTAAKP